MEIYAFRLPYLRTDFVPRTRSQLHFFRKSNKSLEVPYECNALAYTLTMT